MKNIIPYYALIFSLLFFGCTDSELVENWKNQTIETFEAQKVLVLAMSNDEKNRVTFEERLVEELKSKGVNAVQSDSLFNHHFTSRPHTEEELAALESRMLSEGFDAILVSKVIGAEDKVTLVQNYSNYQRAFDNFGEDYYSNQDLYNQKTKEEKYKVYHAQSILYCICPDEERQVIWRASIDVNQLDSEKKAIKDYIKMLTWALEEQQLLIIKS